MTNFTDQSKYLVSYFSVRVKIVWSDLSTLKVMEKWFTRFLLWTAELVGHLDCTLFFEVIEIGACSVEPFDSAHSVNPVTSKFKNTSPPICLNWSAKCWQTYAQSTIPVHGDQIAFSPWKYYIVFCPFLNWGSRSKNRFKIF